MTRGANGHGLPSHVRIAVHQREPVPDERDRGERRGIRDGDQVGILGFLSHGADRVTGEADALGGELVDGFDGNEFGAGFPAQVDEQGEDELGT